MWGSTANQYMKHARRNSMGDNRGRGRKTDPNKPKNTRAVFYNIPNIEVPEALLIGDSIIKNVRGIKNTQVIGLRGLKIEELTGLFVNNQIPALYSKAIVVTHIGTNNLNGPDSDDDLLTRTRTLITAIRDKVPSAEIALSQIIPRPVDQDITAPRIKIYNEAIDEWRTPLNVTTIPTYRAMQFDRTPVMDFYSTDDNLHPNEFGDEALRLYLSNKLARIRNKLQISKAVLAPPPTIVLGKRRNPRRF